MLETMLKIILLSKKNLRLSSLSYIFISSDFIFSLLFNIKEVELM